ncbi:MAG: prolyl oligopeptidase family serine peptidase [Planctomycetales bacterium]|nr:prolyl oligopeptidase family serine peptidase [Planctomycetales bacterium]
MKMKNLLICLSGVYVLSGCMNKQERPADTISQPGQYPQVLNRPVAMKMDYLLYLPGDFEKEQKSWPLLVFLHGAGERGSDISRVKIHGPAKLVEQGKDLPFIVISPQCPADKWWPYMGEPVMALIDETVERYPVDTRRIYLTGLSMGGYGAWAIAGMYPERFAAVVPICGGGQPYLAKNLKDIPVWAFHGAQDPVVPVQRSQEMVDAVNSMGGNAKLTIYPEADHDSWTQTYNNDQLYQWLLSHSK